MFSDMTFSPLKIPSLHTLKPFCTDSPPHQTPITKSACIACSIEGGEMSKRKLLLFLKPLDAYPARIFDGISSGVANHKILRHLEDRIWVHKDAVNFCQDVLKRKSIDWEPLYRDGISKPIQNVDLIVTIGGDGTLLKASRFVDDSIPILGVNSDPTQAEEVEKFSNEFDAARSRGYLCGATVKNFELVLEDILENHVTPSEISRLSISINLKQIPTAALNDILIAHPCPAALSRLSFRIRKGGQPCGPSVSCRSSGLRISTAAGSTAAMLSAGGFVMPILSKDLQYMVREPIPSGPTTPNPVHGLVKAGHAMETVWLTEEGAIYVDGANLSYPVRHGDVIEVSSEAPALKIFLPRRVLDSRL